MAMLILSISIAIPGIFKDDMMGVSRYYDGSSRYMMGFHGVHGNVAVDVAVLWDCIYRNILACHQYISA